MNSSVTFGTVLVNVFFAVTGGTITVTVFYHGNGLHGNYRSFTAVKIPRETPEESPEKFKPSVCDTVCMYIY